ncbi:MAG: hypothetical protein methR_P3843 [Methyloprofundus sp.]|nr:MAG: hypothetical protein methR_P3843 [Methyloprofundus sp.]
MMSDIFFVLTVIYVAYVVYVVMDVEKNTPAADEASKVPPLIAVKKVPATAQKPAVMPTTKPKKVVNSQPHKAAKKTNKASTAPKVELRTVMMKNPKTGEEAKIASNYRMVKRWVKEALVEEGLLPKIYKTNEMDTEAKAEVAKALSIIKAMDKYKP